MLRNYLKIALRSLLRRKFYAALTLLGLAVGLTFALLIGSYAWSEYRVNRDLRHADRQFLLKSEWKEQNLGLEITSLAPLARTLREKYPSLVASYYRYDGISVTVSRGDKHFREMVQAGDSTLLTMFGFPMLHGDPQTALNRPNSVVVTESRALRYFGKTDVIGQTLTFDNFIGGKQTYLVTGVLKALPDNSVTHLTPEPDEVFISMSSIKGRDVGNESWANPYIVNYIELQEGVRPDLLDGPIEHLLAENAPPIFRKNLTVQLAALPDYHFEANNGVIGKLVFAVMSVAVFILLMASINFVNVSIGNSSTRLREIGVRKALGGERRQLLRQFLVEALLLTAVATVISLLGYEVARVPFGEVLGRPLPSVMAWPAWAFAAVAGLSLLVGLLAGSYPALVLSALPVVDSLKGKLKSVNGGILLRRALLTFQFTMAVFVFVGAVVVARQVAYFFEKDLGFDKEQVLTISSVPRDWSPAGVARTEQVRDRLTRLPGVTSASLSWEVPSDGAGNNAALFRQGTDSSRAVSVGLLTTDEHYAQTYALPLKAGRFFHAGQGSYARERVVLNESASRAMGWRKPDEAIDQVVRFPGDPTPYRVSGVTANFHTASFHQAIRPLAFMQVRGVGIYRIFSLKLKPERLRETVATLEKEWGKAFPGAPLVYTFLDESIQKLYQSELRLRKAARLATVLALVIVLLGVQGVVSLSITRRTKEIGIRRVLGATSGSIVSLFLQEFVFVVLLANLLAAPLSVLVLDRWLQNYAYRIGLGWSPFVWVGMSLAAVIGLVVSLQTIRAAGMNPVKSLKTE
ncbi:MAG: ABC transporter permease [Sphingobacteriaceae bacterium]|nr:ABC transporter permease [Cytophagaceae bacterium]